MKRRWKMLLLLVGVIIGGTVLLFVALVISFHVKHRADKQKAGVPGPLTAQQISVVESIYAVSFPGSTSRLRVYHDGEGCVYCRAKFDANDLPDFKKDRRWSAKGEGEQIVIRVSIPPLRGRVRVYGGDLVPLGWWDVSEENIVCAATGKAPGDPGGRVDTVVQDSASDQVEVYLVRLGSLASLPAGVEDIFPVDKWGWDVRESGENPKRAKEH